MQIAALQKLTLLDFPGRTAATIFTPGCSFRCGYCHNPELVLPEKFPRLIPEKDFFEFLDKRKGLLDGVCVTGGEPTLQKDLPGFLKKIRKRGFAVKLDTNGSSPEILEELFRAGLLDYVALDIKAALENYKKLVGLDVADKVRASKNLIAQSGVDYELRTTLVREIHNEKEFVKILEFIRGTPKFFLQNFQSRGGCLDPAFEKLHGFKTAELNELCKLAREFVGECGVRK
ncbi:MAG: anaerobic ribonucleoside-triphosphate reductase activating protein [Candidatus Peribacteraceae bacterium]|nr:anaerobic ribonucleoside-triphosphate reductase activating protein [Candidatus Peribacteraceae bacterium]